MKISNDFRFFLVSKLDDQSFSGFFFHEKKNCCKTILNILSEWKKADFEKLSQRILVNIIWKTSLFKFSFVEISDNVDEINFKASKPRS